MAIWDRLKGLVGGESNFLYRTVAAATSIYVPDDAFHVRLTGTATVTSLNAAAFARGREVRFYQSDTGVTTFTNSPGTTTAGQMDLGSQDNSNIVLNSTDILALWLREDGTWIRLWNTNN